ncbi:MAG: rRNA maturation RNase YbeY [Clostridia bacterium]|nr:rRNA maturation RNase YbeY [Clostridia bacterium]
MSKFIVDCDDEVLLEVDVETLQNAVGKFVQADVPLTIEFLFVDNEEIRRLNAETRGVDKVTDVLSYPTLDGICGVEIKGENFPFDKDDDGNLCIGSVVVCRERAKEQAEEYGHSYKRELHYLFVHGIMHCLGYDHIEEQDKAEMRAAEERVLENMGIVRA